MASKFEFEGFKELEENLKRLEKLSTQRSVMRKAIDDASKHIVEQAKTYAPYRKGRLEGSIKMSGKLNKSQSSLEKGNRETDTEITRYLGSTDPKSHLIEYGTSPFINGGKFKGTKNKGMSPDPFLRPAWENGKNEVIPNLKDTLIKRINASIKRQNSKG